MDQVHEISGLVGRKSECAELRNALDDAANGRGRLLLISGEPGIGKTRLADEFSSVASACHAQVLWGRCWEGAGAPAYWPWIQAIKSMEGSQDLDLVLSALAGETHDVDHWSEDNREVVRGGEVRHLRPVRTSRVSNSERVAHVTSSGGDLEQERFRLFTLVADSFREAARLSPLALVLDDLHDADHSSLLMLKFIARELRDARVAIVGTYREVEVERSKALSSLMARIAREGTHLPLRGLAESDIADFVAVRLGTRPAPKLVTMLRDATDGNPLFLDGVVRMLLRKASSEMRGRLQPPSSLFRPAYGSQFEGKSTRCQSRRRSCCRSRPCLATNSTFVLWSASRLLVEVCSTALTKQSQQEF